MPGSVMTLKRNRGRSADDFIEYLCRSSMLRCTESRRQRSLPEFIEHCQKLYKDQDGKCAVSKVKLVFGLFVKHPSQISIDRLDNSVGYVIGNVRLVAWFVNNARNNMSDDVLVYFSNEIAKNNKDLSCFYYPT